MPPDDPRRRRSTRQPIPYGYGRTRKPVIRDSTRQPTSQRYSGTNKAEKRDNSAAIGYIQVIKRSEEQLRQKNKELSGVVFVSQKKTDKERRLRRTVAFISLLSWIGFGGYIIDSSSHLPVGAWIFFGTGIVIGLCFTLF